MVWVFALFSTHADTMAHVFGSTYVCIALTNLVSMVEVNLGNAFSIQVDFSPVKLCAKIPTLDMYYKKNRILSQPIFQKIWKLLTHPLAAWVLSATTIHQEDLLEHILGDSCSNLKIYLFDLDFS